MKGTGVCRSYRCRNDKSGACVLQPLEERSVIRSTSREMTLSFPPFTKAVTWLLGINTAIFLGLSLFASRSVIDWVDLNFGLVPANLIRPPFEIWQIVTYSFIHGGLG